MNINRRIEVLAPAGSYEGMIAAMNAGCDAVYIGGNSFGARAYANNLDQDALMAAIDEAHIRGKKLYLTVNTLVKEQERSYLYSFLDKLYLHGLDAVIVQDVGAMHFIHRHFPNLEIHASTQTTIAMAQGADLLKDVGVTRLVTPRELSLKEIKNIRENTDLEIETFVHGALCYCYSGQCLMSSMIGGRSGNRGRCAQPCRMPYQFFNGDKQVAGEQYLLSPKDICTVAMIPEMIEAGIDSFKIEGRMKRPEYAAAVTHVYRKYVDLYNALGKEGFKNYINEAHSDYKQDMQELQDIYNRGGFSEGYLNTYNGKKMMSLNRPNHSGVYIGDVISVKNNQVTIALKERVQGQDVLEIRKKEEVKFEFTVKDNKEIGGHIQVYVGPRAYHKAKGNHKRVSNAPAVGDMVFRTKNTQLLERIADDYILNNQKYDIFGTLRAKAGEKLSLTIDYDKWSVTVYHEVVQEAMKQPMTRDKLVAQIKKTGNTIFEFINVEVEMDDNIFVPVAWLNELRRDGIQRLMDQVAGSYRRTENISYQEQAYSINKNEEDMGISVAVQTREQLKLALKYREIKAIYGDYEIFSDRNEGNIDLIDEVKSRGKSFYMILPHICRLSAYETLKEDIFSLKEQKIDGYLVKNFEEIALLKEIYGEQFNDKDIILNYNMYIYNKEAKEFWRKKGISHFTAPVELNSRELKKLQIYDCDMIIYGYQPVMVSAQCLMASTNGCHPCKNGERRNTYLSDRLNKKFFVQTHCKMCYNIIYNGQRLYLLDQLEEINEMAPKSLRLDFTLETVEEMKMVLDTFLASGGGRMGPLIIDNITTGHFKRGIE